MKFAVSYVNFCDNDLKMELVDAEDKLEALIAAYTTVTGVDIPSDEEITEEFLCESAFNVDCLIGAIELP